MSGLDESNEPDAPLLICDPGFEVQLEILDTEDREEDQAMRRGIAALINTYFLQSEGSHPGVSSFGCPTEKQQTGSGH
ncbi:hypothetical protein ACD578_28590 (plasmid) [Microvirga sp. RSM25]|uniref:hypothetical protein n=1 Tax=Microvirga sp. RSM25 TaxID=3273802 RepID=UPI003851320A